MMYEDYARIHQGLSKCKGLIRKFANDIRFFLFVTKVKATDAKKRKDKMIIRDKERYHRIKELAQE